VNHSIRDSSLIASVLLGLRVSVRPPPPTPVMPIQSLQITQTN